MSNATKGITFFKKDNTTKKSISHLHFIISDPDPEGNVLVVNMTSVHYKPREDYSCVLEIGDHRNITKVSYIAYEYAKEINYIKFLNEKIKRIINIDLKERISNDILKKIQDGAKQTNLLKGKFKKYFNYF